MGDRQNKSFWDDVNQKVSSLPKNLSQQASELGKSMTDKATETARKTANDVGDSITHRASEVRKVALHKATDSAESVVKRTQGWVENVYPEAEEEVSNLPEYDWSTDELYHVFVPAYIASQGGTQTVTVKTGKKYEVKIPPNRSEGANLRLKGCGLQGKDAFLILHTLLNPAANNIDRKINKLIVKSPIHDRSKIRCFQAYNNLNLALGIDDPPALNLLDYLFLSSPLYSEFSQRYLIASYNSRLMAIEKCIESALLAGDLDLREQRAIRSTYQYLRSGEIISDLNSLTRLDAIILCSSLHKMLKQYYLRASAMAWSLAVDAMIVNGIYTSATLGEKNRQDFLSIFDKLRQGQDIVDGEMLDQFDAWMEKAELPEVCRVIFYLWRQGSFGLMTEFEFESDSGSDESWEAIARAKAAIRKAKSTVENDWVSLSPVDVLPQTLAESAYNSVSRGGLGLLSGMPILQGMGELMATVVRVAIAQVAYLPVSEKIALGIGHDRDHPTTATGKNWQAVGHFGDTENPRLHRLSSLRTYRGILKELNSPEALTHPREWWPENVLSSQFHVGQLFRYQKTRQQTIKALETQMYASTTSFKR